MHRTIIENMIICDKITDKKYMQHNDKWLQIPDHQYKTFISGGSETSKSNTLPNLINASNAFICYSNNTTYYFKILHQQHN